MTGEIHARLEATFDDPVQRVAAALWPILQKLDADDRTTFADLITAMAKGRS